MMEELTRTNTGKSKWCFIRSNDNPFFESKLQSVVDGLVPFYEKCIINLSYQNAKLVIDYINSDMQFNNIKASNKKNKIQAIDELAKFLKKKYGHETYQNLTTAWRTLNLDTAKVLIN